MRVISNRALLEFLTAYSDAHVPLQTWRKIMEKSVFYNFSDIKQAFNSVGRVGGYYVFDIGGNKFRLVVAIHFDGQRCFVRYVFTHHEYDHWRP